MDGTTLRRRKALRKGRRGEALCAWLLRLKGYRILGRNLRTPQGEIDILARRGKVLAVVEVKARGEIADAGEAVTADKRRRLLRAARFLLSRLPEGNDLSLRFDAMLVAPWRIDHVIDAWRDEGR
jgi:putative endonuclease